MLPINNENRVCVSIRIHTWFIRRPFFLHFVLLQLLSHEMQCIRANTHTHDSRHSHSVKVKRIHCIKCQIVVIQRGRRYNVFVFFHNTHDVASDCRSMFICFLASKREWERRRENWIAFVRLSMTTIAFNYNYCWCLCSHRFWLHMHCTCFSSSTTKCVSHSISIGFQWNVSELECVCVCLFAFVIPF